MAIVILEIVISCVGAPFLICGAGRGQNTPPRPKRYENTNYEPIDPDPHNKIMDGQTSSYGTATAPTINYASTQQVNYGTANVAYGNQGYNIQGYN